MASHKYFLLTPEKFSQLFEVYFDDVTSFLYIYAADEAELKDWVQDVFLKLWEKRNRIDFDHPSFKGYLLTTARNHALKELQRKKKYSTWLEENLIRLTELQGTDEAPELVPNDFGVIYNKVLSKLPPRTLETWRLSREYGLSYPEIAKEMGVSVKTVETQISRTLQILREELKVLSS